jgi:hypothetical protein
VARWSENVAIVHSPGERVDGPLREDEIVLGRLVGHVLADAFFTGSGEPDHRGLAQESTRDLLLEAVERVVVDDQR